MIRVSEFKREDLRVGDIVLVTSGRYIRLGLSGVLVRLDFEGEWWVEYKDKGTLFFAKPEQLMKISGYGEENEQ